MSNKSTNYNLNLPNENDTVNIAEISNNFSAIDGLVKQTNDKFAAKADLGADGKVLATQLPENHNANKTKITDANNNYTSDNVEGALSEIASKYNTVNGLVTQANTKLATKADLGTDGKVKSTQLPASMPANGGNADTLGGRLANEYGLVGIQSYSKEYIENLNDVDKNYLYHYTSGSLVTVANNFPAELALQHCTIITNVQKDDSSNKYGYMIAIPINSTKFPIMYRTIYGTSWSTWSILWTDKMIVKNHSSSSSDYGVATENLYGHVKIVNNLLASSNNLNALSAYQGKVLKNMIDTRIKLSVQNTTSPSYIDEYTLVCVPE